MPSPGKTKAAAIDLDADDAEEIILGRSRATAIDLDADDALERMGVSALPAAAQVGKPEELPYVPEVAQAAAEEVSPDPEVAGWKSLLAGIGLGGAGHAAAGLTQLYGDLNAGLPEKYRAKAPSGAPMFPKYDNYSDAYTDASNHMHEEYIDHHPWLGLGGEIIGGGIVGGAAKGGAAVMGALDGASLAYEEDQDPWDAMANIGIGAAAGYAGGTVVKGGASKIASGHLGKAFKDVAGLSTAQAAGVTKAASKTAAREANTVANKVAKKGILTRAKEAISNAWDHFEPVTHGAAKAGGQANLGQVVSKMVTGDPVVDTIATQIAKAPEAQRAALHATAMTNSADYREAYTKALAKQNK